MNITISRAELDVVGGAVRVTMRYSWPIVALCVLFGASPARAQQVATPGDSASYWNSVHRGLAGDTLLDYAEMRFAFGRLKLVPPAKLTETLGRARGIAGLEARRAA